MKDHVKGTCCLAIKLAIKDIKASVDLCMLFPLAFGVRQHNLRSGVLFSEERNDVDFIEDKRKSLTGEGIFVLEGKPPSATAVQSDLLAQTAKKKKK